MTYKRVTGGHVIYFNRSNLQLILFKIFNFYFIYRIWHMVSVNQKRREHMHRLYKYKIKKKINIQYNV